MSLRVLQSRLERMFQRLQIAYDLTKTIRQDPRKKEELIQRSVKITKDYDELDELLRNILRASIEEKADVAKIDETVKNRGKAYEDMYYVVTACFKNLEAELVKKQAGHSHARLPKIELKSFNGALADWPSFYGNFQSLIHHNPTLDAVSKFHYLTSVLSGPPLTIATELEMTAENYEIVWENLVKRYQNKRLLASDILNKILNFALMKGESSEQITHFLTVFEESVNALKTLNFEDLADFLILHLALRVLPSGTKRAFERQHVDNAIPKFSQLTQFMREQLTILEVAQISNQSQERNCSVTGSKSKGSSPVVKKVTLVSQESLKTKCLCCGDNHLLFACPKFGKLKVTDRRGFVQKHKLCFNCLREHHVAKECRNKHRCTHCHSLHHSLLHDAPSSNVKHGAPAKSSDTAQLTPESALSVTASPGRATSMALLGTATFHVKGAMGRYYTVRGIIDSGATTSFVTHKCARKIGLNFQNLNTTVSGIGNQAVAQIKGKTVCFLKPCHGNNPILATETLVIPEITSNLPSVPLSSTLKQCYQDLTLADPNFHKPGPVDFLIGADIYPHIYTGQRQIRGQGVPPALSSIFGWVITGKVDSSVPINDTALLANSLEKTLRKFWEVEELPKSNPPHPEDIVCEEIFRGSHYRLDSGNYVVPLLLKDNANQLGDSQSAALTRLSGIERRLNRNPDLKPGYQEFLDEYEQLGHMTLASEKSRNQATFYLPHHCVRKEDSTTTKLRVVFDASQRTTSGLSLNDVVYTGPKLQQNIFDVIMKFRLPPVVFTCDICKMYRQIFIRPSERTYQHIFWKKGGETVDFELNTVTYGVASSPYLALRVLRQLAEDDGSEYPQAARVIREEIYIDDIVTGSAHINDAKELQSQVIKLLSRGGFSVRKWASNRPELLDHLPVEDCVTSYAVTDADQSIKILGMKWDSHQDRFFYDVYITPHCCTKRNILSHLARIYDPLGWIAPIVFKGKTMMQKLWLQGLDWDTSVPPPLSDEWQNFYQSLSLINGIKIDRQIPLHGTQSHTIIGFCDASQQGYAAAVYLRTENENAVKTRLVAAKTRVAPTKTISIPRLELCGAHLLAGLMTECMKILSQKISIDSVTAYTDSTVVLAWLKIPPCQLKTFVANRVTYILENIEPDSWRHVSTDDNPADIASRGCLPDQLVSHPLWWTGPKWLAESPSKWPISQTNEGLTKTEGCLEVTEIRPQTLVTTEDNFLETLSQAYSTLSKLQRVTAWMWRFITNARGKSLQPKTGQPLSVQELDNSLNFWIHYVQKKHFSDLISGKNCSLGSLKALQPFVDNEGFLRVGGRLRNSSLPIHSQHPILLPKKDTIVNLIIDFYHKTYLHAGPRTLQSLITRQYWILAARSVIRSRLSKCLTCFKTMATPIHPLMGDLPSPRVTPSKVFLDVGLDFGGPFIVREHKRRNPKLTKAYLCLFICLATKAVHLEAVSDLSSSAFLAGLDRFVSRRGLCRALYSDCGTNFTGAKRSLNELYDYCQTHQNEVFQKLAARRITWHLNPPSAPHFGGIWEAGIKSVKYHLKRVVGNQTLTFEELATIFTKIEAMLNSRPLCALSLDVSETNVLTPGHFLVGGPIVAIPEVEFIDTALNRLSRWQLMQQITQRFWNVWAQDYLHTLQQRNKWRDNVKNLKIGDLVLLVEPINPPTQWKIGIVEHIHPGKDQIVRVVTIRTAAGIYQRPVAKLCPLPTSTDHLDHQEGASELNGNQSS